MNQHYRRIANDSGFVFWDDEEWKPADAIVDWSTDYDHELSVYSNNLVSECASLIQDMVDKRIPASEYPKLLREHFGL
jgi:hypothetical protein